MNEHLREGLERLVIVGREGSNAASIDSDDVNSRIEGRVDEMEFMSNTIEAGLRALHDRGLLSQPAATRASSFYH